MPDPQPASSGDVISAPRSPLFVRAGAGVLFLAVAGAVLAEARNVGVAWAENDYLDHIAGIVDWAHEAWALGLRAAVAQLTEPYWAANRYLNPHPPLFKYMAILTGSLLPGLGLPLSLRASTALAFAGGVAAVFVSLAHRRGCAAAVVGALALATMPRLFGHAMLCTPDIPLAMFWLGAALAYLHYEETRRIGWLVLAGALCAAGVACKISGLLMLVPLGVLMVIWRRRGGPSDVARGAAGLLLAAFAAVATLVLTYPFLWPDPVGRFVQLVEEAAAWSRTNAFTAMFFGWVGPYTALPWYFGSVMVFLTTPPLTLGLALVGLAAARGRDRLWQLAVVEVLFWLLLVAVPSTPKYDNERQMLPAFTFLAILAGIGWHAVIGLAARRPRIAAAATAGAALVLAVGLVRAQPFPLRYFTPLVGGPRGAVALGFEPTTLMEVLSPQVLADFQAHVPSGAGVSVLPSAGVGRFLQRRGLLRADLRLTPERGPYWILVNRHNVLRQYPGSMVHEHGQLLASYALDGVALAELRYLTR